MSDTTNAADQRRAVLVGLAAEDQIDGPTRMALRWAESLQGWGWRTMQRNPGACVRGRIRQADHKAVVLHAWHRVLMNTEDRSKAMQNVAFLD